MDIFKRGSKIIGVCDGIITGFDHKGYYILEDSWITEEIKYISDSNNNIYRVLDMITIEQTREQTLMPYHYIEGLNKHTCIKLKKEFNIGYVLYCVYPTISFKNNKIEYEYFQKDYTKMEK